jgi:hypothetical protein
MGAEFPLLFKSPGPIVTIRNKRSHLLMASRYRENEDGHAIAQIA